MKSVRKNKMKLLKSSNTIYLGILFLFTVMLSSCYDDNVGNIYTNEGLTIGQYITQNPEQFSEFSRLLDTTKVKGLLNAYGVYTCFLPDNEAMKAYYQMRGRTSLDQFPLDSLQKIAYDHIIQNYDIQTSEFGVGFLARLTMSGRYLKTDVETGGGSFDFYINTDSKITEKDVEMHNGIIHVLDKVLNPTENTVVEAISEDENFTLLSEALLLTGVADRLTPIKDESYVLPSDLEEREGTTGGNGSINRVPFERRYGFTIFAESDQTYRNNGINNIEDLKTLASTIYDATYPEDAGITDVTNPRNSLYRYVAYHCLNKKVPRAFLIERYDNTGSTYATTGETHSVKAYDMFEYLETLNTNTLIEVRTDRTRIQDPYNILNRTAPGVEINLTDNYDNDAINGVYHEIDNILVYSQEVRRLLSTKRLRMDAASFFPELANNSMRVGHARDDYPYESWRFTDDYIDRVKVAPGTSFGYLSSDDRFLDYQGDEVFLSGLYDFEITTLPIPAGTYEVRFGWQPTIWRGAAQIYWDGKPCGIPLDLRLTADDPKIGWEKPGDNYSDPLGYENDKMMRNRGYMKGPASFKVIKDSQNGGWYNGPEARNSPNFLRKILGIFTFDKDTTHVMGVKAAREGEFMFDFLEFVPIEIIESEGID
ncbi:fasciclin domain-containing protein [Carboxylicivirga linearis]|uniref:Fasciclin domain-containing protein n=1 Tax=Carboxylicivirga linearis TaxID=1628157 RepID=A0ABS5JXI4_9BACT|nr:fasciclin domain-containing protein [Carboxylicivirga linearis]MBS2099625.1 fasciclin domain-containing protein [Carboxylicivirga linearis]